MAGGEILTMDSIVRIVSIFIIYSFIVVTCFYLFSTPMELVFTGFEDADFGDAEDEKDSLMPTYRATFTLFFALFISLPVTWFVMKIFSREPSFYQVRRY